MTGAAVTTAKAVTTTAPAVAAVLAVAATAFDAPLTAASPAEALPPLTLAPLLPSSKYFSLSLLNASPPFLCPDSPFSITLISELAPAFKSAAGTLFSG